MGEKHEECESVKPFIRVKNNMGSEDIHYSVTYDGIPSQFSDVALKELNETEENKRMGILKLRDYLKGKCISYVEDHILISVLRSCKYDVKKAEKKLIKYLQTLDMITKQLQTADLKKFEIILKHRFVGFLPYRDKHGRLIGYTTPYDFDFSQYDMDDAALCSFCVSLYVLSFPLSTITGVVYIGENKTSSLSLYYRIIKGYMRHVLTSLTYPCRIAKIEVINEHALSRWSYNVMKPLLPSKITRRIQFHGNDLQGLQKLYNSAILPEEFGGTLGPINPKLFMDDILKFIQKLKSRNIYLHQE